MEIFDLAAKLGQALKADERLVALEKAKKAYESDPALRRDMTEYEVQQKILSQEITKGEERDLHLVEMIQNRIDELFKQINANPVFTELDRAQTAVNELMARVNDAITYEITGELPGTGCPHDCNTCGGCH